MSINLKRLVKKREIFELVKSVADAQLTTDEDQGQVTIEGELKTESIPILIEGVTIGWVTGSCKAKGVAAILSYIAKTEYEKKSLGRETLEKYKEINLLYDVAEKLADTHSPRQVAQLIIDVAKKIIKADNISIMLLNEETNQLAILLAEGQEHNPKLTFELGQGIVGSVVAAGKAEIVNHVQEDARYVPGGLAISSLMCAPLKIQEKVIGAINLSSLEPVNFTAHDLKLLSALALQASAAIENTRLYESLKETFLTTVQALAETIEKRDPYTGGHTRRVMNLSIAIAKELGLCSEWIEKLKLSAILHDIGKIGVRDNVLLKNGKLDEEEFKQIQKHPVFGKEMLQHIKDFREVIPGVKQHHERFDGKGYPKGLKGYEIDMTARIIAVADTYDAMTSDRPYRKGLSDDVALAELQRCAGSQFDPEIVEAFLRAYHKKMLDNGEEE